MVDTALPDWVDSTGLSGGIDMIPRLEYSCQAMKIGEISLVDSLNIAHQRRMLSDQPYGSRLAWGRC